MIAIYNLKGLCTLIPNKYVRPLYRSNNNLISIEILKLSWHAMQSFKSIAVYYNQMMFSSFEFKIFVQAIFQKNTDLQFTVITWCSTSFKRYLRISFSRNSILKRSLNCISCYSSVVTTSCKASIRRYIAVLSSKSLRNSNLESYGRFSRKKNQNSSMYHFPQFSLVTACKASFKMYLSTQIIFFLNSNTESWVYFRKKNNQVVALTDIKFIWDAVHQLGALMERYWIMKRYFRN